MTPAVGELGSILAIRFKDSKRFGVVKHPFDILPSISSIKVEVSEDPEGPQGVNFLKNVLAGNVKGYDSGTTPGEALVRRNLMEIEAGLRAVGEPLSTLETSKLLAALEMAKVFRTMISAREGTFLPGQNRTDTIWAAAEAIRVAAVEDFLRMNMTPQQLIAHYLGNGMDFTLAKLPDPMAPSRPPQRRGPKRIESPVEP